MTRNSFLRLIMRDCEDIEKTINWVIDALHRIRQEDSVIIKQHIENQEQFAVQVNRVYVFFHSLLEEHDNRMTYTQLERILNAIPRSMFEECERLTVYLLNKDGINQYHRMNVDRFTYIITFLKTSQSAIEIAIQQAKTPSASRA